jgi:hypothetical protein
MPIRNAPAFACSSRNRSDAGANSGTPFAFSEGSGFVISPHVDPGNTAFTSQDPRMIFHPGKAPS